MRDAALLDALRRIAVGEVFRPAWLSDVRPVAATAGHLRQLRETLGRPTPREFDWPGVLIKGMTNREIAGQLGVTDVW